ncbi:COP9 signalosome complex subunit 6 [Aspergillus ruber CBS 135680]|uniref:COP9 signalosome complex subunit 6 n=1 Tax=Aspergillus ruber (strain CBS 135680) TaxID=1388766 RepID=A0A017SAD3_ASPRC|nr:putative COP9 signalosome subunit 6 [Aspergillus ruber CBS 135680]EYE93574.1 putative COP9 signalosome subunit 6 [Aspergillus ruber CBS 135680]
MADQAKSLVSQKSSDSGLHIQLHPLILLSISDHITRHAARQQQGPIIGALLGQQDGREITLEHTFECLVAPGENGEAQLPHDWFVERVKQLKDVHKVPALDLVGWWSTAPPSGPNTSHLPIHRQILQNYNESAVFLTFHPSQIQIGASNGSKLPLTVYESVYEGDNAAEGDKSMQVDNEEQSLSIRFRELPYSIETGEAEMIGVDTVARSARNAASDTGAAPQQETQTKGKKEQKDVILSPEEEELVASLNTRLNAVRTLESRVSLIKSYISTLSTTGEAPDQGQETPNPSSELLSHSHLRNINSLLANLSLLSPPEQSVFSAESLAQTNDVLLVSLLGQLGQSVKDMRELGRKAAIVNNMRQSMGMASRKGGKVARLENEFFGGREGSSGMFA